MTDEKLERNCSTCACSIIQKHHITANETQMFCRRQTVMSHMARLERPALDPKTKQPMFRKGRGDEKPTPIMETFNDLIYLFAPTLPELVCFDGWRPVGTPPGDFSYKTTDIEKLYTEAMAKLSNDMRLQSEGVLADYPDHSAIDPKKN